jgi:hypothetical protein
VGGKGALSKLALAFSRGRGSHPNSNPIVALGAGGYQHKIKSRGFIHVPTLRIAGWAPRAGEIAKVSAAEAMNDAIPF